MYSFNVLNERKIDRWEAIASLPVKINRGTIRLTQIAGNGIGIIGQLKPNLDKPASVTDEDIMIVYNITTNSYARLMYKIRD
jgi:hypothetical protein